jgi:cytochrome c peroxidase
VTKQYRTTPLRGLWQQAPYFYKGVAAMLTDVVELYDTRTNLKLTEQPKADVVACLKSL